MHVHGSSSREEHGLLLSHYPSYSQYEAHYKQMIVEALAEEQKLFVTVVLEPFTEEIARQGRQSPGSLVHGRDFLLSCGCICKVGISGAGFMITVLTAD